MKSIKNMAFGWRKAKEVIKSSLSHSARLWVVALLAMISSNAWGAASIAEGRYELVTDLSTLTAGDKLIITGTADNKLYAAKPFTGSSADKLTVYDLGSWSTTSPTASYDITTTMGICEFSLGGTSGAWTFYDGNYSVYQDNDGKLVTTSGSGHTNTWVITSNCDGVANCTKVAQITIKTTAEISKKYVAYNSSGSGQFRCYTSAGGMYIFKKVPAVTLHYGAEGELTSTIAIGADFPDDGDLVGLDVAGWGFDGKWATSADKDCEPDHPSGSTYNSGTTAAAGTYYAVYYGIIDGCNFNGDWEYSCTPTPTYALTVNNASSGSGVNWVVPDVGCGPEGTTITLTLTINVAGTEYQGATIVDANNQAVPFTYDDSGADPIITFDLPASDVTATVNFECPDLTSETVSINTVTPFYDTSDDEWKAHITWQALDGATRYGYQLKDKTADIANVIPQALTTNTYLDVTDLTANHQYSIHVKGNNPCDGNNPSTNVSIDTYEYFTPQCSALEGTLAISLDEVGSTTANLSWSGATTPAIQTESGANSSLKYDVQITRTLPLPAESTGGTLNASNVTYTSWEGTGLTTGATYRIDVTAKNACGETMAASRTFKCKAYEDYQFTCADLSITDEEASVSKTPIWITTSAGQIVRSQKALHIEGSGLAPNATFTFTIGGVAANDCSGTGEGRSIFAIRNSDYTAVTATPSGTIDADVYVFYNPAASSTTDGLDQPGSSIVATSASGKVGDREYKSMSATLNTTSVNGRHLPSQFVMAARIGKSWYALPGNITTNATQDPVMIGVNNASNPTIAYCPAAYGFRIVSLASTELTPNGSTANNATGDRGFYTDGEKVKFGLQNNLPMFGSTTTTLGNGGGATSLWGGGYTYFWKLEHTNTAATDVNAVKYNIRTANSNSNPLIRLSRGQWKWGLYSYGVEEIRLLSISPVQELTLNVMEWGTNEMAVSYNGGGTLTNVIIGDAEVAGATISTIGSDGSDIKRISNLGSLVAAAEGKQCQQMLIQITENEGGDDVLKQKILTVPFIVTGSVTTDNLRTWTGEEGTDAQDSVTYITDVVVRSGGTLTTSNAAGKFANTYIYPGGKVDLQHSIRTTNIYLRGGFSWLGSSYALPQMKATDGISINGIGASGHGVYYDLYLDNTMYYVMALPKTVALSDVTNEEGAKSFKAWIKVYNGENRTTTPKTNCWEAKKSGSIERGVGYEVAIKPRVTGRPYGILRFPLLSATSWTNETSCSPSIVAWGAEDEKVTANNKGWNFLGNPFFTAYNNTTEDGSKIEQRGFTQHIENGHWTGAYDFTSTTTRYFTIPNYTDEDYQDVRANPYKLDAFYPFFVQSKVGTKASPGTLEFGTSGKSLKLPSIKRAQMAEREVIVDFQLKDANGKTDKAGLTISNDFSADFDMDDQSKTIENGTKFMKVYTMVGAYRTAFNALPEAEAAQPIPVGYIAPTAGEYTFSLLENADYSDLEHLWLTDGANTPIDLLTQNYSFTTAAGEVNDRFTLNAILKAEETATEIANVGEGSVMNMSVYGGEKHLVVRGLPIGASVWVYDAAGKLVATWKNVSEASVQTDVPASGVYNVRAVYGNDAVTKGAVVR